MKEILSVYPIRNYESENTEAGNVVILYKELKPNFIEKIFFKERLKKPIKIELDEIGSFVWNLCDGKLNIESIIKKVKDKFGENIESAEQRVELFLKQMMHKQFVKFYQKK